MLTPLRSDAALLPLLALSLTVPLTMSAPVLAGGPTGGLVGGPAGGPPTAGPGISRTIGADQGVAHAPGRGTPGATEYRAPAPGPVAQVFDLPEHRWEPGHRGIDLWSSHGSVVTAPGAGVVTFAGSVAGKPVVVVTHPDGLRSSLEPVEATVAHGTSVRVGDPVGVLATTPGGRANPDHCAALASPSPDAACVHWGVRRAETYLDPRSLLGTAPPIVLLPVR